MVDTEVVPEIKNLTGDNFNEQWFQQDGAPCHSAKSTIECLNAVFRDRLLSRNSKYEWPPYSCDLTVCDYWFFARLRQLINQQNPCSLEDLKIAAILAVQQIPIDEIRRAIDDFLPRLECLEENQGGHFELYFKQFKRRKAHQGQPIPERCYCNECNNQANDPNIDNDLAIEELNLLF